MRRTIVSHLRDFVAIAALAAVGIGTAVFILANQDFRFPFVSDDPFELKAELTDAGGVKPGQNQPVRIAFVRVGEIADLELEDGRALLTLEIDPEYADRFRRDATALLRPRTGLEDMFLDVDPGSEDAPPAEEGDVIPIRNTLTDVDSEQILNALDRDARDYLELLVNGAGKGLEGRGGDLRKTFERLEPLHRDLARVNDAFADQREKLERLVHNYGLLTAELSRTDDQLTRLVTASEEVFEAFASQDEDISLAVSRLPSALRRTETTLRKVDSFSDELGPALESLRPAFDELPDANEALTELALETTGTIREDIRPFVREAKPFLEDVQPAAADLAEAMPDLETAFGELNRLFNMAAFNPNGAEPPREGADTKEERRDEGYLYWLGWLAHNTNSLFSTSDASGPFRRANFLATCTTLRQLVADEPISELIFGVTNVLADTGVCPEGGT